jgi:hypothetical protein
MSGKRNRSREKARNWLRRHFARKLFDSPYSTLGFFWRRKVNSHIRALKGIVSRSHKMWLEGFSVQLDQYGDCFFWRDFI